MCKVILCLQGKISPFIALNPAYFVQKMINFAPVYDGKFFYKDTSALRNEAVVNPVPYIIGCNSTEGHGIMTLEYPKDFKSGITHQVYMEALKGYIGKAACVRNVILWYFVMLVMFRRSI